jgi:hypothetical protein
VLTSIDTQAASTDEGPEVRLRPRWGLVVESHLSPERAQRLVSQRASIVAERIFGSGVIETSQAYDDTGLKVFSRGDTDQRLVVGCSGSVIVLANGDEPARICLNTITGKSASLESDAALADARKSVAEDSAVFAFVTPIGLQKLIELAPIVMRNGASEETATAAVSLLEHLSRQASDGLAYAAGFANGGVRERIRWGLKQPVAEALAAATIPSGDRKLDSLRLVPRDVEGITLINIDRAGELPERLLKQIAPRVDVVVAIALRELVKATRKQYGLEGSESVGSAIGEVVLVDFGDGESSATLVRALDRNRVNELAQKYLALKRGKLNDNAANPHSAGGSSDDETPGAVFVGDFLVIGDSSQIARITETERAGASLAEDANVARRLLEMPRSAAMLGIDSSEKSAGRLMLALSQVVRATDGSPEILERDDARAAIGRIPRRRSFTEVRDSGVYIESESAVGIFGRLASLFED